MQITHFKDQIKTSQNKIGDHVQNEIVDELEGAVTFSRLIDKMTDVSKAWSP